MIPKETLIEIGKRKKLTNREYIEKDYFQDIFLFSLFKKTNIFVFKGGTALYKIHGLSRFSEDLDFSLVENSSLEEAEKNIKDIIENNTLFEMKSVKKIGDSLLIKIKCQGILTKYNSLRIDINFKNKLLRGFEVKTYVSDYIDINPFSLRILKLEEIIAEKVHSIFNRNKARDLYDLFFLLRISDFDRRLVEQKLGIFNIRYNIKTMEKNIDNIGTFWEKELRAFVLEELPEFNIVRNFVLGKIKQI